MDQNEDHSNLDSMIEDEFSFKIPIDFYNAKSVKKIFNVRCIKKIKTNEKIIKRQLTFENTIINDIKETIESDTFVITCNSIILSVNYKKSKETYSNDFSEENWDVVMERCYTNSGNFRWSLETIGENFFIHCENENCQTIEQFLNELSCNEYNYLLKYSFCANGISYEEQLKLNTSTARNFTYIYKPNPIFYAPKLDGVRYLFYMFRDRIIIPDLNRTITGLVPLNNNQIFIGNTEVVNDEFYLIDVCQVASKTIYTNISILKSIEILKEINNLNKHIKINFFTRKYSEIVSFLLNPMYDGYLIFYENAILKVKENNTIDLLVKQIPKNTACTLYFRNDEMFLKKYKNFKIDWKDFEFKDAIIVELYVFRNKLEYFRTRYDKVVANSIAEFEEMIIKYKDDEKMCVDEAY